jgi:predicted phosphodiesterase
VLPDIHFPHHDAEALRCALRLFERAHVDGVLILGDALDVGSFNSHGRSPGDFAEDYLDVEVEQARALLDVLEGVLGVREVVYVEGNHEARVARWLASHGAPASLERLVAPKVLLSAGRRSRFTWVDYFPAPDRDAFVEVAPGLVACHGWTHSTHAAAKHLDIARGYSVVHGHTHRAQRYVARSPVTGAPLEAWSPGTLARLRPTWAHGKPTTWTHGASLIHTWRRGSETRWRETTHTIYRGEVVAPDGSVIQAGAGGSVIDGVA